MTGLNFMNILRFSQFVDFSTSMNFLGLKPKFWEGPFNMNQVTVRQVSCSNQGAWINKTSTRDPYKAEIKATLFALRTINKLSTNE